MLYSRIFNKLGDKAVLLCENVELRTIFLGKRSFKA